MRRITYLTICIITLFPLYHKESQANNNQSSVENYETIIIVADTWCPYNCNPKAPHPGFMVDLAKQAFAKHNINVEYKIAPWTQAIEDSRKGKYNAIIAAAKNDAPDFIFPDTAQGMMRNRFYITEDSAWRYKNLNSLNGIIIGTVANYTYPGDVGDYIAKYRLDSEKISEMSGDNALGINLSKMMRGKIGTVLEAKYVMEYYLSQNNLKSKIKEAGSLPHSENDYLYIAFSPKNRKLSSKYAQILAQETENMRKSGELAKIFDIYDLKDWENPSEPERKK